MSAENAQVLEHLRSVKPADRAVPSLEQVRAAITAVRNVQPLADTLASPVFTGWEQADLVGVIEGLGKFISQSRKSSIKAKVISWDESPLMWPLTQDEIDSLKAKSKLAEVLPGNQDSDGDVVFVPVGWAKGDLGRDVGLSMATAATVTVADQDVVRFIERHYRKSGIELTADHVYLLVWLAEEGQLSRLAELTSSESALAAVLVKAWDLLEVFSSDAYESMHALAAAADESVLDIDSLLVHCTRCEWMAPGEVSRVRAVLAQAQQAPDSDAVHAIAKRRLQSFQQAVQRGSIARRLSVPTGINIGHAQMVCEQAGLLSREVEEKSVRTDIRERLTAMGLANDLDQEISEGIRAWKAGLLEEFYSSRASRAEGDLEWASSWEQTLLTAGVAR